MIWFHITQRKKQMRIRPRTDNIFCIDADFGDTVTNAGIIIKKTLGKESGVTPRWMEVFDVGPEIDFLKPGQWVYVEYGRWTEGFTVKDDRLEEGTKLWKVDPNGCMLVADEKPNDQINIKSADYEFEHKKTL